MHASMHLPRKNTTHSVGMVKLKQAHNMLHMYMFPYIVYMHIILWSYA
jgi:hypothetical protein